MLEENEKRKTEDIFPISVLEIDRTDIENAVYTFDDRTVNLLREIKWDKDILEKIAVKLRRRGLRDEYLDLLPSVIKEVFMDEIEEANKKQKFFSGLTLFIKNRNKKK